LAQGVNEALPDTLIDRSFRERIIICGMILQGQTEQEVEEHLDELELLVDTAGADVVGRVLQRRDAPDPGTFFGSGKVAEIAEMSLALDVDTVVFDDELSPAQQRNLQNVLGRTAIDRTAVILDIFAQNARSPEGKAQVELAILSYRLPRLRGRGTSLSQQGGGIGTRGPGETQLEVDRRRLVRRMHKLQAELKAVAQTRHTQRGSRRRGRHLEVALVGYTNAGKSSLLNALTGSEVDAENRLFVTLDPRTRQMALPGGETLLFTDTVGFIRKLPHQLVEAFRSTLDTVTQADLIVHVVDGSAKDPMAQIDAVRTVIDEIGGGDMPELLVLNKIDLMDEDESLRFHLEGAVEISAKTGAGLEDLLNTIAARLHESNRVVALMVPFDRGDVLAAIHREGDVLEQAEGPTGMLIHVLLDEVGKARFSNYEVAS